MAALNHKPEEAPARASYSAAVAVAVAAAWLVMQDPAPSPVIPFLRSRFNLTAKEAVESIREATLQRGRALRPFFSALPLPKSPS